MQVSQINPLSLFKTDFYSTKELYSYAKKKIIYCAKKENKEYLIIANTKNTNAITEQILKTIIIVRFFLVKRLTLTTFTS